MSDSPQRYHHPDRGREPSPVGAGTIYLTVAQGSIALTSYVIHVFAGRTLGPAQYGTFGLLMGFISLIRGVILDGVPTAISKFIAEDSRHAEFIRRKGLVLQLGFALPLFALCFFLADHIAIVLQDRALAPYLRMASAVLPFFAIYLIELNVLNGLRDFRAQARTMIVYSGLRISMVVFAIWWFDSLRAVLVAIVILNALMSLLALTGFRSGRTVPREDVSYGTLLDFAVPIMVSSVGFSVLLGSDLFFVKALLVSDESLGFYVSARAIAHLPILIFAPICMTVFPTISGVHHQRDMEATRKYTAVVLRYALMLMVPFAALTSGTATAIISLVYSGEFSEGGTALAILVVGTSCFAFFYVVSDVISATGRPKASAVLAIATIPVNLFLHVVLIPKYGIAGAAIAATSTYALLLILALGYARRRFGPLMNVTSLSKVLAAGLGLYFVSSMADASGVGLVVVWLLLLAGYAAAMYAARELTARDLEVVRELVQTIATRIRRTPGGLEP